MHVDAITIAEVADEWRKLLTGARIDAVISPTEHAIAIQCYAPGLQGQGGHNYWIYLSAHPQFARAHLTTTKPSKIASEPPSFVMLLRKYLEGTRIEAIVQPRWERVLEIVAGHRSSPESSERTHYRLVIELMGRMSNIILCDEQGLILGSLKHVGADVNRYRVIAPNVRYVPPPPQQHIVAGQSLPRLEPTTISAAQLSIIAAEEAATPSSPPAKKARSNTPEQLKLWQLLTRHLLGFSHLLATEAVYRATGKTETAVYSLDTAEDAWEELAWNVRELAVLFDNHNWHPQVVERIEAGGGNQSTSFSSSSPSSQISQTPIAFAPYILEQYAEMPGVRIRQSPSMNVLIDEYYAGVEWRDAMETVRAPLRKILQTQRERCIRKAELLQRELSTSEDAARYRLQAELLLAYQHEVQQGQASVTLQNFFEDTGEGRSSEVTIPLDPRFDAVGNAYRLLN
jgi:predicted ribosome quality control (RQC) complex YloA/Tae2 family protein